MRLGIPKEIHPGEHRVAATPDTVRKLSEMGFDVRVQRGAGVEADIPDDAFAAAGATLVEGAAAIWSDSDLVVKVRAPKPEEVEALVPGTTLLSLLFPAQNPELVDALAARRITALALDAVPRISRAQKMDVLSSMGNIAGYRAVIEAVHRYRRFFGGQITAAGKTAPAQFLVIGAGVAGLAAIAAARGLGAVVRAFDTRMAVKEQVESLGASFLELEFEESGEGAGGYAKVMSKEFIDAEMALFRQQAREVDIIITTALIPGKRSPVLITRDMVESMKPGSIVVDLAAEQGGNCEYTVADQVVEVHGVTIIGYTDLTSRLPSHASQFFAQNVLHMLDEMGGGAAFRIDHEDEAIRGALVLEGGELRWPAPEPASKPPPPPPPKHAVAPVPPEPDLPVPTSPAPVSPTQALTALAAALFLVVLGRWAPAEFIEHFTVFVLSCFIGWQVVWNVTPALHTPLMSVTNAISGIIIVGGVLQAASAQGGPAAWLGAVAVLVATINIAGGFLVTQRMLQMFRR